MSQSCSEIAEHASFQAFINGYLREVDGGVWHNARQWYSRHSHLTHAPAEHIIELALTHQKIHLALAVDYSSLVGRHRISAVVIQQANESWQPIDFFPALLFLINEIYTNAGKSSPALKEKHIELILRVTSSLQLMTRYLQTRQADSRLLGDRFIESEQSLLYGHWLHPTPKSRQGMADWLQGCYSPEMAGRFQLHYFAVKRCYIKQDSIAEQNAECILRSALGSEALTISDDYVLVPAHPLQAQWMLHQDYIQQAIAAGSIRDLGRLGLHFTATSSVRTVYSEHWPWMLKFSIPVKITNSLRLNHYPELVAGKVMASLLRRCGFSKKYPQCQIIDDPAYLTVQLPGQVETGFELIIRFNPFLEHQDTGVHSIAALVQDPLPGFQSRLAILIDTLATKEKRNSSQVARDWFERYLECAIVPLILLYEEQGIALEAHQQNSLLDVKSGYPTTYFYRDNQGFYLSPNHRESLVAIEPSVRETPELFYDDDMICDRFSYYLIINQLYSVIHRLGADRFINESTLLACVRRRLRILEKQLHGTGKQFVQGLLQKDAIPCKANLLTRLHDIDELTADLELAVYTHINNPLAKVEDVANTEVDYEVA